MAPKRHFGCFHAHLNTRNNFGYLIVRITVHLGEKKNTIAIYINVDIIKHDTKRRRTFHIEGNFGRQLVGLNAA